MVGILTKQFDVWRRLAERFLLDEEDPSSADRPRLLRSIQPITDADALLRTPTGINTTAAVTGTGVVTAQIIPDGERWTIYSYVVTLDSGTWTHGSMLFTDVSNGNAQPLIDVYDADVNHKADLPTLIPLDPGDLIQFAVATHSVNGNARIGLWVDIERVF